MPPLPGQCLQEKPGTHHPTHWATLKQFTNTIHLENLIPFYEPRVTLSTQFSEENKTKQKKQRGVHLKGSHLNHFTTFYIFQVIFQ